MAKDPVEARENPGRGILLPRKRGRGPKALHTWERKRGTLRRITLREKERDRDTGFQWSRFIILSSFYKEIK